jgi:hypothetical protein
MITRLYRAPNRRSWPAAIADTRAAFGGRGGNDAQPNRGWAAVTIAVPTSGGWTFKATLEEDEHHMLWLNHPNTVSGKRQGRYLLNAVLKIGWRIVESTPEERVLLEAHGLVHDLFHVRPGYVRARAYRPTGGNSCSSGCSAVRVLLRMSRM